VLFVLLPYDQQLHAGASGPGSDDDGVREGVIDGVIEGVIDGVREGVREGVTDGVTELVGDGLGGTQFPVSSVDIVPLFTVKIGFVVSSTQSYNSPINCIVVLGDIL